MSERYYSNRDLSDECDSPSCREHTQKRPRQRVLDSRMFAPEAARQYVREHPETDPLLAYTLKKTARHLERGDVHPRQRANMEEFVDRITR